MDPIPVALVLAGVLAAYVIVIAVGMKDGGTPDPPADDRGHRSWSDAASVLRGRH